MKENEFLLSWNITEMKNTFKSINFLVVIDCLTTPVSLHPKHWPMNAKKHTKIKRKKKENKLRNIIRSLLRRHHYHHIRDEQCHWINHPRAGRCSISEGQPRKSDTFVIVSIKGINLFVLLFFSLLPIIK